MNTTEPQPISHMGITTMATFRASEPAPWGVLDHWVWQGHPLGVFTVLADHATGEEWFSGLMGDHQGNHGLAVVDELASDPADRLREANRQSQERQNERLGGDWELERVWPPPGADTMVAVKVAGDTRHGWLRVTWDQGEVHVQSDTDVLGMEPMKQEISPDLDLRDRDAVLAWAKRQDYGLVWASWAERPTT